MENCSEHRRGPTLLTHAELIGISILLARYGGEARSPANVYYRAWEKLQSVVEQAIAADD